MIIGHIRSAASDGNYFTKILYTFVKTMYRGADKSLAQPGKKNKLQRPNSNFCKSLKKKKKSEGCPSNQISAAAMTSVSDEKWRPFTCFFRRVGLRTYQHPCIMQCWKTWQAVNWTCWNGIVKWGTWWQGTANQITSSFTCQRRERNYSEFWAQKYQWNLLTKTPLKKFFRQRR